MRRTALRASVGRPDAVAEADIVVCATTARTPVFDSTTLPAHAVVVAIGSHEPDAREVDSAMVERATVVVESRVAALREAGDIVLAIADGVPSEQAIDGDLAELVGGDLTVRRGSTSALEERRRGLGRPGRCRGRVRID